MTDNSSVGRAPLTLVTAYFALPRRSRKVSDYHAWMANLLPFVEWPLVIFCDAESLAIIKRLRGAKPAAYRVTRMQDFCAYRHCDAIRAHAMQRLGRPAGQTIGIDATLIWHEKANFVRRAIAENPYRSEMFFWCDIGLLRRGVFRPSPKRAWPNLQIRRAPGIDWLCRRRHNIPGKTAPQRIGAGNIFISLYLLNGARFPWACLGREVRLRRALRLPAGRVFG